METLAEKIVITVERSRRGNMAIRFQRTVTTLEEKGIAPEDEESVLRMAESMEKLASQAF